MSIFTDNDYIILESDLFYILSTSELQIPVQYNTDQSPHYFNCGKVKKYVVRHNQIRKKICRNNKIHINAVRQT